MNYFKYIKTALNNKAVRIALITIPPAALMFYLGRSRKQNHLQGSGTKKPVINSELPETNENFPETLEVDNLSPDKSIDILNENTLTGETDFGECIAVSAKGTRCKRKAVDSSRYCWQHKKLVPVEQH
jgi:hypothetical protein